MGFLDNTSITVDAVLTKKGREILKNGGDLRITQFTLSDAGVDYTLWNSTHSEGSSKYGEAIENLPMLEANVHSEYNLRNRLLTLNQNATAIPSLQIGGTDSVNSNIVTFTQQANTSKRITVDLVGYNSMMAMGMAFIIQDPTVITTDLSADKNISGVSREFLSDQGIKNAKQYSFTGGQFILDPLQMDSAGRQTNVFIFDKETGAYASLVCINNITSDKKPQNANPIG